jgi:hypothetical protein
VRVAPLPTALFVTAVPVKPDIARRISRPSVKASIVLLPSTSKVQPAVADLGVGPETDSALPSEGGTSAEAKAVPQFAFR